jgi:hypothetical protein
MDRRIGLRESRPLGARLLSLLAESDTTPVRFLLMLFALAQAVAFYVNVDCTYVGCKFMQAVMPFQVWGAIFAVYAAAKIWRILDGRSRPLIAGVINGWGAALFGGLATALVAARWPDWILAVPYMVFALAAVWVFARTAINPQRGFRSD